MTVEYLRDYLISMHYRYFFPDAIQSLDDGTALFHYDLHQEIPIGSDIGDFIAVDSNQGSEIIQEFIQGTIIIWLGGECQYRINPFGRIFRDQNFKKLEFKKYDHDSF